jgi:hypothetical protein
VYHSLVPAAMILAALLIDSVVVSLVGGCSRCTYLDHQD